MADNYKKQKFLLIISLVVACCNIFISLRLAVMSIINILHYAPRAFGITYSIRDVIKLVIALFALFIGILSIIFLRKSRVKQIWSLVVNIMLMLFILMSIFLLTPLCC